MAAKLDPCTCVQLCVKGTSKPEQMSKVVCLNVCASLGV